MITTNSINLFQEYAKCSNNPFAIMSSEELLQCYDAEGNPTESRPRSEVKQQPPRWWHGVARIWMINDLGQVMCARRSMSVSANPGKWQPFFGGHVSGGHTFVETARKELTEEAGLERTTDDLTRIYRGSNDAKMVFIESFVVRFNGQSTDLNFSDNEVSEAKWIDIQECWKDCQKNPDSWANIGTAEEWDGLRATK